VKLLLHSQSSRNSFTPSQRIWTGASARATFLGLSWSKDSKAAPAEGASPNVIERPISAEAIPSPAVSSPPLPVDPPPEINTPLFDQLPDTFLTSVTDITEIEKHIGFLKEMGLDYGWGPRSFLEFLIESIHVYGGTPWWGTVILTATAVRLLLLYPQLRSTNEMAKMGGMKPVMDKLQIKSKEARANQDPVAAQAVQREMLEAKKIAGLKMRWMYAPMLIQGVLGWCSFTLLRAMATLPVPGLEEGGFLWLPDLTVSDPLFILPVAMAGMMHVMSRVSLRTSKKFTS
jgi:YidC/Oxa1 family membrane protein insertase